MIALLLHSPASFPMSTTCQCRPATGKHSDKRGNVAVSTRQQQRRRPLDSFSCSYSAILVPICALLSIKNNCPIDTNFPSAAALSVTTFNMLASVHRSMPSAVAGATPGEDWRESDRAEWWMPRAKALAKFVASELASSDLILLQEWWNRPEFCDIFDAYTSHIFERVSEQRPGLVRGGIKREDGMAVLIKRTGRLELINSSRICTGPQRIAQIVHCREKYGDKRNVIIGNTHLSFPGGPCQIQNERKQAYEALLVARAVAREGRRLQEVCSMDTDSGRIEDKTTIFTQCARSHLELIAGDFNSNSCGLAATSLERHPYRYVNSMSASAQQALTASTGGRLNLGVTHRNHLGETVSVDHVLARLVYHKEGASMGFGCSEALLRLGYFDSVGTRLLGCQKRRISLEGDSILSDHRPVTALFEWPSTTRRANKTTFAPEKGFNNSTLHFLQSPWDS